MDLLPRPEPDRKEIIRYLGYRGSSPGPEVLKEIEYCARELEKAAEPRFIYEKFELTSRTAENGGDAVFFAFRLRARPCAKPRHLLQ